MTQPTTYDHRNSRIDMRAVRAWLNRYSIDLLRVSLGVVFILFGILKFFPGVSPAEDLAIRTVDTLTLGVVSGGAALWLTAVVETFID